MISSSDKEYIETKMIKKGLNRLSGPFVELADWIFANYGVKPMNITYDILEQDKRPRLQIIFELSADLKPFKAANGLINTVTRQEEVKEAFCEIIKDKHAFASNNLLVLFSAFEPIAKEEANERIQNQRIEKLKSDLNSTDLWEIKRNFSTAIFFLYTNDQVVKYEQTGDKEKLKHEYFKIIKECDEFGYLDESTFSIKLDSKENLDKKYKGNWFYYSRDN